MQTGDHLISPRPGFTHHGLYVGNNEGAQPRKSACVNLL